ncbi:peptidoglycan-binding protein [Evansella tamaricis]|uniref:Peptidoglycan-binding protein n=1 Tax=Evansella tamaricis TaxID=2069301 RepID=A0ABS6JJ57_9BACI|nr:peptidoglycan-binding protein [Evansella tamaricis]MBU9713716.1 peptidoglycan-binding protein [Evansella tamaricis]
MKKYVLTLALAGALFVLPDNADAALGDQTLREGMRHGDVVELQEALRQRGYFTFHTSTGFFGTITTDSVRRFQRDAGITVDGIFGPQSFRALTGSNSSTSTSSNSSVQQTSATSQFSRTLREGMRGDDVVALQEALRQRGHFTHHTSTGFFGTITRDAVRSFQRSAGITVDGIAGPQTFRALNNTTASSGSSNVSAGHVSNPTNSASSTLNAVINTGKSLIGTPYVWAGSTPAGFDCSGFLQYVFAQHGISIPRTVATIHSATTRVSTPQVGDLVFFETYAPGPSHAGIYLGNGEFLHAGSSTGVTITKMSNSYWSQRYLGAGRINQ